MMSELPCLPLICERFWNEIKDTDECKLYKCPDFSLYMFPQVWGSTALGFGGVGGQAITSAYTTVIDDLIGGWVGVFFGERLAYKILNPNQSFFDDVCKQQMAGCNRKSKYIRK